MRQDLEKFYSEHFGTFKHLSAIQIAEMWRYEFAMLGLPEVLFIKDGWMINNGSGMVSHAELSDIITNMLLLSRN